MVTSKTSEIREDTARGILRFIVNNPNRPELWLRYIDNELRKFEPKYKLWR